MGAFTDAENAIRQRLAAAWTTTPVVYENQPYEAPGTTPFVFCEILQGGADQMSLGSTTLRLYRLTGIIILNIFTPAGTGTKLGNEYADSLATIFRGVSFSGVLTFAPRKSSNSGPTDDGKWHRISIITPFQFDANF